MARVDYPEAAKRRIALIKVDDIDDMIGEIPKLPAQAILNKLPAIRGFRRNEAFEKQRKRIIERLTGSLKDAALSGSRAWYTMGELWVAWGSAKFFGSTSLAVLLDQLNSNADARTDLDKLKEFVESARIENLAREDVKKFITFGPFEEIDAALIAMERLPTRKSIEAQRTIERLPNELPQLVSRLNALSDLVDRVRAAVDKGDAAVKSLQKESHGLERRVEEPLALAKKNQELFDELSKTITAQQKSFSLDVTRLAKTVNEALTAQKQLHRSLSRDFIPRSEWRIVDEIGDILKKVEADLTHTMNESALTKQISEEAASSASGLDEGIKATEQIIGTLVSRIGGLEANIDDLRQTGLDAVVSHREPYIDGTVPPTDDTELAQSHPMPSYVSPAARARPRRNPSGKSREVSSIEDSLKFLILNFEAIGVQKSSSHSLAREIMSAIMSFQPVGFSGSMAQTTMQVTAEALFANNLFEISIPLGLTFELGVPQLAGAVDGEGTCAAILVGGINKSDFDIFGSKWRDWIVSRQSGLQSVESNTLMYAVCPTPGGLSIPPSLAELGPIFDTDSLDWRLDPKPAQMIRGQLTSLANIKPLSSAKADGGAIARLLDLVRNAGVTPTIVWRRALASTLVSLQSIAPDPDVVSAEQSVIYGWIMPLLSANECICENLDELLSDELSGSPVKDVRIERALEQIRKTQR